MSTSSENSKLNYILHLADNSLILGQRLGEWCGHGPVLEQDIALTNIALDLIGQARYFYQYAALTDNRGKSEDHYPYFRGEREFKNFLLLEQPNMDWAYTMARQFYYDSYCFVMYTEMLKSKDEQLVSIASKAIKEVSYHLKYSSEWVIRMGDGTEESHEKVQNAVNDLWEYCGEFFETTQYESEMIEQGIAVDASKLKEKWLRSVGEIFNEATLIMPEGKWFQTGGKEGVHTENLGYILTDLQYIQKTMPGLSW
ncbi:MAG: phenylacetate-CoA oxygenase subunit PaaC [Flavobacteriales bacterium]|nr:phenylacetate-CoA oxygenase subunit PaaC [Flavobacteriales bacterium]